MRPRGEGRRRRAGGRAMNGGASSMRPRGELRRVELPAVRRTRCQAGCRAKNPSGACFGRQSTSSRHRGWLGDFIAMVPISFKLRQLSADSCDYRHIRDLPSTPFSIAISYSSFSQLDDDTFAPHIWHNAAPSRCRSFLWLVHHHKLNTNARLRERRANNSGLCPLCAVPEDVRHLFLFCPRAKEIWAVIGLPGLSVGDVESLWGISLPGPNIDNGKVRSTLWNIWKRRNALVFRLEEETCVFTLRRCSADLQLWRHRVQDRRGVLSSVWMLGALSYVIIFNLCS
ncbi:uncharacterized protein LOC120711831 [Panicum virgatum]|uniref:uncharacterized protein LOC120711831 n=1 Tax=Panicum virgatum TaxID=38727 RepID=UPI0019D63680|nr:uncharacterized protein LOC120711831 [Panicum virgatum]